MVLFIVKAEADYSIDVNDTGTILVILKAVNSVNQVTAAQCLKLCRYRSRALANVYIKHFLQISVAFNVVWLLVPDRFGLSI